MARIFSLAATQVRRSPDIGEADPKEWQSFN
jgi:hypothetical protein